MKAHPKPVLLVFPFGFLSHYLRCMVLCRYLENHYQILFARHPAYSHYVAEEGFELFDYSSLDETKVLEEVKGFGFRWLNASALEKSFLSSVNAIEKYKAAAVLGDAVPGLKMAAEATGVLYGSILNGYMTKYYAGVRRLPPAHPAACMLKLFPSSALPVLTRIGEGFVFKKIHRAFRKLRHKYNLSVKQQYLDEQEGDVNFICDLPHFFPQKSLPANYIVIGPLIYEGADRQAVPLPLPADNKKVIYVTMGSTGNWTAVAFLNDPYFERYHVIAAGDAQGILRAPHIIRVDFAAVKEIFPRTDLVICHGGNGTIYQALYYGIPLLFKTSHFEQEWNASAVEERGLGKNLRGVKTAAEGRAIIDEWVLRKQMPRYREIGSMIQKSINELERKLSGTVLCNL